MHLQTIEKYFIPLLFATLFVVAFTWQFSLSYNYIIEHFKEDRLSTLYAHLFTYSFLVLSLFIFMANLFNHFILKSKFFIGVTMGIYLTFYALSYSAIADPIRYFIEFPLSSSAIMGIVIYVVGTLFTALYPLILALFKKATPLSHILFLTLSTVAYSLLFINTYCYPISKILTKLQ